MRAVFLPDVPLPQVYRLLFLKPLSRHLGVAQLEGARWTSARAETDQLYTRARARSSAPLYRSWRGSAELETCMWKWKWPKKKEMLRLHKLAYKFTAKSFKLYKKQQLNSRPLTSLCLQHTCVRFFSAEKYCLRMNALRKYTWRKIARAIM